MCGRDNCRYLYSLYYPEDAHRANEIFDEADDCCGHPFRDCIIDDVQGWWNQNKVFSQNFYAKFHKNCTADIEREVRERKLKCLYSMPFC